MFVTAQVLILTSILPVVDPALNKQLVHQQLDLRETSQRSKLPCHLLPLSVGGFVLAARIDPLRSSCHSEAKHLMSHKDWDPPKKRSELDAHIPK